MAAKTAAAEACAGRREVVVTELKLSPGPTLPAECVRNRQQTESNSGRGRQTKIAPSIVLGSTGDGQSGPQGMHTVLKVDFWLSLLPSVGEWRTAYVYFSGYWPGSHRVEVPTLKNVSGAGTEMIPVDTWVTAELLVKVCVHFPEAKKSFGGSEFSKWNPFTPTPKTPPTVPADEANPAPWLFG